jgi:hypothetical protein
MAHQAIISTISTCLPINPFLGLQHEILSDKLLDIRIASVCLPSPIQASGTYSYRSVTAVLRNLAKRRQSRFAMF